MLLAMDRFEGLTAPEAAERLKVKQSTVLRWLREKKLRGVRLGGTRAGWRVTTAEVERMLTYVAPRDERQA